MNCRIYVTVEDGSSRFMESIIVINLLDYRVLQF